MKRRWIVIIFTICFGMGMLLPVHAQEKDKIWAGTNSKIEKAEVLTLGTKLKTPIMHVQQHVCMDIMLDMT